MTREEWAAWAKSLKPGDSVIVKTWCRVLLDTVRRVTPAGWVVTENNGTFSQSQYRSEYSQRGGYYGIMPVTEELRIQALDEMAKAEKRRKTNLAIATAKRVTYDWTYGKREVDYDLALKILALAGVEVIGHEV